MTEDELRQDVARWFHSKDSAVLERVFAFLVSELRLPATFKAMFQSVDAEDLIVEVIEDLLRREHARFREAPLAYARSTLRNRAVDRLRKKGQRGAQQLRDDLDERAREPAPMPDDDDDARRVLEVVAALPLKGRLALLLTTAPDRISAADWEAVAQAHPPPPPARPGAACESDEASRLLYPPPAEETPAQREQRLDTFSKARLRAVKEIRARLGQRRA